MSQQQGHSDKPIHVYDGIEEMDNKLPNWWLGLLWLTIGFAVVYWFYVQVSGRVPTQYDALIAQQEELKAKAAHSNVVTDEALVALSKDVAAVAAGKQVFTTQCAACHGAQAQGVIGPNLTDEYWLHGGRPTQIHATVTNGVAAKGMPTWGPVLGPERIRDVVAYLLTIKNTHVPGKAPQGDREPITAAR